MKVNNVYAEEIAKWDGDKAAKPFRVLWDDPESGADLKVVYRTPKIAGTIMLAIGMAAIAFASYCGWRCFHEVNYNVLIGFCIIFAFGIGMTVSGLRTSWTRMEYEFKRGICTVRYALAGLLRREWSFAYNDKTGVFAYMRPMSDMFATVPEYGFTDNEGGILFRTKQAMKIPHYDYFSLVVAGYLSRNEDEEKSRQVLSVIRLERNLRDKSTAKKMWIFLCIIIAISVTMSTINNRNKPTKEEQLTEKDDITAWRHAETVRRLKAITIPEACFYAPATMKDFVEYMSRATKDFDSPDIPPENRGITFVCADSVAAKTGPEKPKQATALIPCDGIGATTTAWDALTNVCNSVGCRFKVYSGKVEIGK